MLLLGLDWQGAYQCFVAGFRSFRLRVPSLRFGWIPRRFIPRWCPERKPNGDLQAAAFSIVSFDGAVMQPHSLAGNRQAEASPASTRLTAWGGTKEGPKDVCQGGFRNTGALIEYLYDNFPFDQANSAIELYFSSGRRIPDRVTKDIVDGATEEVGICEKHDVVS